MTRLVWVTFFLLTLTFSARAQWSASLRDKVLSLNKTYTTLDHTGLATFWGGWKRTFRLNFNDGETISWETPLFRQGQLPLYFSAQTQAAPLVVLMPGIFGTTNAGLTPMLIDRVEKARAHVLVVPNLVSTQYVHAYPLYGGDIVQNEVQVLESALEFALSKLGQRVSSVHVIAESLGTMPASAWAAWDATHRKRIATLTLLYPPLDLSAAMDNFDSVIKDLSPALAQCSQSELLWAMLTEFVVQDVPDADLSLQLKRCFAARVVVKAFLESAQKSYLAHAVALRDTSAYTVASFRDFFSRYRPELWAMIEKRDERLRLATWIKALRKTSNLPVRILTSRDDFLNLGQSWAAFLNETQVSNDHVLILDWGGHSGPLGADEMDELYKDFIYSI